MNIGRLVTIGCILCLCSQVFASPLLEPLFVGVEDALNLDFGFSTESDTSVVNPYGSATANVTVGTGSSTLGWHDSFPFTGSSYTGFWEFKENIGFDLDYTPGETKSPLVSVRVVYFQIGYSDYDEMGLDNPVDQKPAVNIEGGNLAFDYGVTLLEKTNSRDAWVVYQAIWQLPAGGNQINVDVLAGLDGSMVDQVLIDVVPEPASLILLGIGSIIAVRRRKH